MPFKLLLLLAFSSQFLFTTCMNPNGRSGHGLIGYGIEMYRPYCCFSCRAVLASSILNCSEVIDMEGMHGMDMDGSTTSPACYATNDAFLHSLAYCIKQRCTNDAPIDGTLRDWQIEEYWQKNVAGTATVQPDPKVSWAEALARMEQPPVETLVAGEPLNKTMLVSDEDYQINWNALLAFEDSENSHERYGLVVLLSGFVVPVAFSLLRWIPLPKPWISKFYALLIDPPALGSRHKVPILWGLASMPTRGQAFFVAYLTAINVVLCAVGYSSEQPNAWWPGDSRAEILTYITNRCGVLSFANVPLLILYAGRNNVLLWLTNWSHETFLLLHRFVAIICTIQACIHSAIYLQIYVASGEHSSASKTPFWFWGIIATLGMSVLLPTSILPLRQKMYELFLSWHVVVSVLVLAGCYLHIYFRFQHQWGYEVWMYCAFAVWGFDRVFRVLRLARNGVCTAKITVIDEDYIRVDVAGVVANGHAYLYFPTLTWRIWENHPFSVASTVLTPPSAKISVNTSSPHDIEKSAAVSTATQLNSSSDEERSLSSSTKLPTSSTTPPALGLTFLLRTRLGLTASIRIHTTLPVLIEASYGQSHYHDLISSYPTMICIVGGVGISACIPLLQAHAQAGRRTKLLWGVRNGAIVEAMQPSLDSQVIEMETFVGKRMNVREELEREIDVADAATAVVVVVSGPASLADEARNVVCDLALKGRRRGFVKLIDEAFSW